MLIYLDFKLIFIYLYISKEKHQKISKSFFEFSLIYDVLHFVFKGEQHIYTFAELEELSTLPK